MRHSQRAPRPSLVAALAIVVFDAGHAGAARLVFRLDGEEAEATFGSAVVGVGDVDGDGVPDLAVGAPQTLGPGGGYLDGRVFVYSGATKALLYQLNPVRSRGFFGARLAPAGDLDGDGVPDLIVGAPATSSDNQYGVGSVLAFSGASGESLFVFLGDEGGTYMGSAVAGVGDLDGDGVPEIVIGTPYGTGRGPYGGGVVTVRSGSNGAVLYEFDGSDSGDFLGRAAAGIGDVDGDGVPDLLVAAPNASPGGREQAGLVQLRSGATGEILRQLDGADAGAFFGQAVANMHDLDGDGVDDFAVAAPSASPGGMQDAGSVFVYSGASGRLLYRWDGQARFDTFGAAVAGGDDVDGDGVPDVIVGAPGASPGGLTGAGSAFVFSGATGELLFRWDGQEHDAALGQSVGILGDLDGDGRAKVLVGTPYASPGGRDGAGSVFVLSY
jgi:hypothetical protein